MYISVKTISLFIAILLTGLSAGLFYAWSVSVIPGTKKLTDLYYLEAMQSINRAILNPAFFLIFFGSMIMLAGCVIQEWGRTELTFWFLLIASMIYLAGTFGITGLGNVPLNNALDKLNLNELATDQLAQFRQHYEIRWNRFHLIRTISAVSSFLFALLAAFTKIKYQ